MTILYKVESKDFDKDSVYPHKFVLCKISSKNLVAFSVLQDTDSLGFNNHVYICDIVTPWQYYKVCSSKTLINVIEWSPSGEFLLLGFKGGNVEIWTAKNQSLNTWIMQHTAKFPSEDIIYAKFFHNGKNLYYSSQKKDLTFYAEKFERLDHRATLTHFGGTPIEGCIIITASGLLGAFVIPKINMNPVEAATTPNSPSPAATELSTFTHSIGLARNFISHCCISHCPTGGINIAVSCGWHEQLIHCFKVNLKIDNEENIAIKSESQSSLFLNSLENKRINHIKWSRIGSEDVVFIAIECTDGTSQLEQWNLTRRHQSVHALLQQNKGDFVQCETWEATATLQLSATISEICISKIQSDSMQIFAVLSDNTVQVLDPGLKKSNQTVFERFTDERQLGCKFIGADLTPTNQVLLVFDNFGQMYAMQTANSSHFDKNFKLNAISTQVQLLEYCITTGMDASDILMLNLSNLDILIEKLTENFTRQPVFARHYYYSNFLSLKSNVCRIQSKHQDFDNLIILHSISITFKSLLRPSDLGCQDKGPAENLSKILSEHMTDVDTVLLNLDAKDFTVEPLTLQSLQQLIQWVADLALNMLDKLPEEVIKAKMNKRQGYDISRDIVAITSIRELLVMIRIWGLLNPQCLPIYTKSMDNIDVLSILFRLLTRLAQNTAEPDEVLLDECSLLSTQVLIPPRQVNNPTTLLSSHMAMSKSYPLIFSTLVEPLALQDIQMEEVVFSTGTKDGVSNLQLGSRARPIRKCARCGFVNSTSKVTKTSALKAWCNKWLYCHCGGFWKLIN